MAARPACIFRDLDQVATRRSHFDSSSKQLARARALGGLPRRRPPRRSSPIAGRIPGGHRPRPSGPLSDCKSNVGITWAGPVGRQRKALLPGAPRGMVLARARRLDPHAIQKMLNDSRRSAMPMTGTNCAGSGALPATGRESHESPGHPSQRACGAWAFLPVLSDNPGSRRGTHCAAATHIPAIFTVLGSDALARRG